MRLDLALMIKPWTSKRAVDPCHVFSRSGERCTHQLDFATVMMTAA